MAGGRRFMWTSEAQNKLSSRRRRMRWVFRMSLIAAVGFLCSSVVPNARSPLFASPASGLYEVREIKPHIFVWLPEDIVDLEGDPDFARTGTAAFVVTTEGVVVVDTTNSPFHARELLYEIRQRTDEPVRYVIDTDSEGDYTLGNEVFSDLEATILGSAGTQAEIGRYRQELQKRLSADWRLQARMRGIHPTPPTQTVGTEMTLRPGGEDLKLSSFADGLAGQPPTADTVAYLPAAKVVFTGGLFENAYYPRLSWKERGRDIRRWIEALKQLETWDVDLYVPGHGPPASKREVAEFRQFLEWLASEVEARVRQGKSLVETRLELQPALEGRHWHARELMAEAVDDAYRQISTARSSGEATRRPSQGTVPGSGPASSPPSDPAPDRSPDRSPDRR